MSSKRKGQHGNQARTVSREKGITVSPDSLQTKAPGSGPSRGNEQAAVTETSGTVIRQAQQAGFGGSEQGERGGAGAQQAGWSSRQQAERLQARGEEARRGEPQQSGYGGAEQNQHAGSQESPVGPPKSRQAGTAESQQRQDVYGERAADSGSRAPKQGGSDSKQ
jgi:hypothetical protein